MKFVLTAALVSISLLGSVAATAAERTATLKVEKMNCAGCPYIIKTTLARLDGVNAVKVSYRDKTAVVTYDDEKTDVAALTAATGDLGFPSTFIE